jgi:iron complex outermembrane recepter protein
VINVVTARPGSERAGFVDATLGNYDALVLKGGISGPLGENFAAGITFASTTRDGYVRNLFDNRKLNDVSRRGARLQLTWDAPFGAEFYWTADTTTNTSDFALTQLAAPFAGTSAPFGSVNSRLVTSQDQSNLQRLDVSGVSQTIDFEFANGLTLTSVTAYRKNSVRLNSDSDALPIDIIHAGPFTDESDFASQELRLTSRADQRVRYVLGGYYFTQEAFSYRAVYVNNSLPNGFETIADIDTDAAAAFVNLDFDLTESVTLTGGVRYTTEDKSGSYLQRNSTFPYAFPALDRTDSDVSWTASLTFRPTDALSFYGTASKGFKSGGFNVEPIQAMGVPASALSYAPENLRTYEIGAKGRLADNRFRFGVAGFFSDFENKQVSQFLSSGVPVPIIVIGNAAEAEIKGFEAEVSFSPNSVLTLDASVSRLLTRYTSFPNAARVGGVSIAYTGNRLENAPALSGDLAATVRIPVGNNVVTGFVRARHTGDTHFQADNAPIHFQKDYTTMDARLGLELNEGSTIVSIWGKNLTDEEFLTFSRVALGNHQVLYGEPQMYGLEVSWRF